VVALLSQHCHEGTWARPWKEEIAVEGPDEDQREKALEKTIPNLEHPN
jgi:hypothetical protein